MHEAATLTLALCVVFTRLPPHCVCQPERHFSTNVVNYAPYNKSLENDGNNEGNKTNPENGQHHLGNEETNYNEEKLAEPMFENPSTQIYQAREIKPENDKSMLISACDNYPVIIEVTSRISYYSTSSYTYYSNESYKNIIKQVSIPYKKGEFQNPEVSCFKRGEPAELIMRRDGMQVQVTKFILMEGIPDFIPPLSAIKSTIPDQQKSEFVCTDVQTGCEGSLSISVTQVMNVISPNMVYRSKYKIRYGNPMTVSCSGPADARLEITKNGTTLKAERVDKNTIQIFISEPDYPTSEYGCINLDTDTYERVHITVVPGISIRARNEAITPDYYNMVTETYMYRVTYGDPIEVYCSAPRDVKIIHDSVPVLSKKVNSTTIKFSISKLKVGDSVFGCIYSDASEPEQSTNMKLVIIVMLRMDAVSPNIRRFGSRYVVRPEEPLEIVCSGPAAGPLTLSKNGNTLKDVHIVNDTSIKLVVNKSEIYDGYDEYVCPSKKVEVPYFLISTDPISNQETRRNQEEQHARVIVEVSTPAEAKDFHCVSNALEYMNCSWSALSYGINFTLSYTDNGNTIRACEKIQAGIGPKFCVFDYRAGIKTFMFLMQSCNGLGCTNQRFSIDHILIVKPAPPLPVTIKSVRSLGVTLNWNLTSLDCAGKRLWSHRNFDHKVEHSYRGIVHIANPFVDYFVKCYEYCVAVLNLPCPDQLYEVRVYHKLKTAGDEFWSDPTSVTVSTSADIDKSRVIDHTCDQ